MTAISAKAGPVTIRELRERPILFSGPMVRAILEGRKTQTRRVVKPQPTDADVFRVNTVEQRIDGRWAGYTTGLTMIGEPFTCPYGQPGDRLWVRETWDAAFEWPTEPGESRMKSWADTPAGWRGQSNAWMTYYAADQSEYDVADLGDECDLVRVEGKSGPRKRWQPSIHMPRWASRLTLEITEVRVERLQEISEADAIAEGIPDWRGVNEPRDDEPFTLRERYAVLWDGLNASRGYGWDANPWVWVVSFRRADDASRSRLSSKTRTRKNAKRGGAR